MTEYIGIIKISLIIIGILLNIEIMRIVEPRIMNLKFRILLLILMLIPWSVVIIASIGVLLITLLRIYYYLIARIDFLIKFILGK